VSATDHITADPGASDADFAADGSNNAANGSARPATVAVEIDFLFSDAVCESAR